MFTVGTRVMLTQDAADRYGKQWESMTFVVRRWYDHACHSSQMWLDPHGHPAYDGDEGVERLYDLDIAGSRVPFEYSVYDDELVRAI